MAFIVLLNCHIRFCVSLQPNPQLSVKSLCNWRLRQYIIYVTIYNNDINYTYGRHVRSTRTVETWKWAHVQDWCCPFSFGRKCSFFLETGRPFRTHCCNFIIYLPHLDEENVYIRRPKRPNHFTWNRKNCRMENPFPITHTRQ